MKIKHIPSQYTNAQLLIYLERIRWEGEQPQPTLQSLSALMRKHLCAIPFTNIFITHEETPPSVDPQELFQRMVVESGGFFCFGQNLLFREMLRAIGFRCYSGVARVNPNHEKNDDFDLGNLNHMTIFVSFEDDANTSDESHLWLADVGFGALNINQPLPLHTGSQIEDALNVHHRAILRTHPRSSLQETDKQDSDMPTLVKQFALEYQENDSSGKPMHDWRTIYSFSLAEFHSEDYEAFHFSTCRRHPLFTKNVVACLLTSHGPNLTLGRTTLFNDTLKTRTPHGTSKTTKLKSERDRLEVLRTVFGLLDLPKDALDIVHSKGFSLG